MVGGWLTYRSRRGDGRGAGAIGRPDPARRAAPSMSNPEAMAASSYRGIWRIAEQPAFSITRDEFLGIPLKL